MAAAHAAAGLQARPTPMSGSLDWDRDGADWPHRDASRFVSAGGVRWHVQQMGAGPVALLLHGTGAATHSWRDLMPLLAPHLTLVAPDLPGHGFSSCPSAAGLSLPGMAKAIGALLAALDARPAVVIGHSAGAAILARMCLDGAIAPGCLVSLNGALLPLGGFLGRMFSPAARLLAEIPAVPRLFAWRASDRSVVERLIRNTGSRLDAAGIALYARLAANPGHVAAALGMMAGWDLDALACDLPRLSTPLMLVVGGEDGTIAPSEAYRVRALVPHARVEYLRGLGHLAHEERPEVVAALIRRAAAA